MLGQLCCVISKPDGASGVGSTQGCCLGCLAGPHRSIPMELLEILAKSPYTVSCLPSPVWMQKGLCDIVPTPGAEPTVYGPPPVLTAARHKACWYTDVYIFMFHLRRMLSVFGLMTPL